MTTKELKQGSFLAQEQQQKTDYSDLEVLRQQGHILVTQDRKIFLPTGTKVQVFAVGAGGAKVRIIMAKPKKCC